MPLFPRLEGSTKADVVVIGAGICGVSATLALAERGVDVLLLEADVVAGAATGRNAGLILQGTAERYTRAAGQMGREQAKRIHAFSIENHDRIQSSIEKYAIDCGYRRAGSLQLAGSAEEERDLLESAEALVNDGFEAQVLQGADLPDVYRRAGFATGVYLPQDGELHPARFVRGAALAAHKLGARIHEGTAVHALDARGLGDVRVDHERGQVEASLVLVCTNAAVAGLLPWYADKVDPVRGQMLATAPAPRIFDKPVYADHGFDYWRQDEAGCIVLGGWRNLDAGSERGFEDRLHAGIQEQMVIFLRRFEALSRVEVTHRWSGIMGFSRDGLALIGAAPGSPGVLAAAGFTGHGLGFAWLAGSALADLVVDGTHPFADALSPKRML